MTYDLNITFDDNLITGNKTIDTQHKELIERIQNFVTACQNGDSKLKAIKMLDYLDEYTNFHFKEEEKLQQNAGYPEYEKHHEKHEEFKKTIQELQEYLQDYEGPTEQFSELVQKNVIDWLFGHIKTYDRSVAEFIFMRENPSKDELLDKYEAGLDSPYEDLSDIDNLSDEEQSTIITEQKARISNVYNKIQKEREAFMKTVG